MGEYKYLKADTGLQDDVTVEARWLKVQADGSFRQCTHTVGGVPTHGLYPCTNHMICATGHIADTYGGVPFGNT